jgi:hypothetical protein
MVSRERRERVFQLVPPFETPPRIHMEELAAIAIVVIIVVGFAYLIAETINVFMDDF